MLRSIVLAAAGIMIASACQAQDAAACAALSSDKDRLECYDLVHRKTVSTATTSKWQVSVENSRLDDSKEASLFVRSLGPIRNRYGQEKFGNLVVNCRDHKTNIYIVFGGHFMSSLQGAGKVSTRVDKNTPKTLPMQESNDHSALGLWGGKTAIPFIKDLFGGDLLYVRATPYNESSVEMDFPIVGLEEAIKPVREACRW